LDWERQIHRTIQEVSRFRGDKNFQWKPFGKTVDGADIDVLTVDVADTLSVSPEGVEGPSR